MMDDGAEAFQTRAKEGLDELRSRFAGADRIVRETVNEYPLTTLLAVVLGGYLVGRLVSRRG